MYNTNIGLMGQQNVEPKTFCLHKSLSRELLCAQSPLRSGKKKLCGGENRVAEYISSWSCIIIKKECREIVGVRNRGWIEACCIELE